MLRTLALFIVALMYAALPEVATASPFALVAWTPPGDGTVRNFRGGVEVVDLATGRRNGSPILIPGGARLVVAARLSDRAYVATRTGLAETGIAIVSLSSGTVLAHVPLRRTGEFIKAIALSGDERQLYVLHSRESDVTVVDTSSGRPVKTFAVSGSVDRLTPGADGRRLYAPTGIFLRAWDTTTWTETLIPYVGSATILVASPDSDRLYVGNSDDSVSVFDLATLRVASTLRLPGIPAAMALSGDGRALCVGYAATALVSRIDTVSLSLTSFAVPARASLLAASPDGAKLLVSEASARSVWILDGSTGAIAHGRSSISTAACTLAGNAPVKASWRSGPAPRTAWAVLCAASTASRSFAWTRTSTAAARTSART